MGARKHGKGENCYVERGQVITSSVGYAGRQHDDADGHDLNGSVDFSQQRRPKTTKPGDDVDGSSPDDDENIPADDCDGDPERNRQVTGDGGRENASHR